MPSETDATSSLDTQAEPEEARYLFDPTSIRRSDEPSEDGTRLIWMFLRLLRKREIDFTAYAKEFARGEKTFRRDIAKLRAIGSEYAFTLTRQKRGRVQLAGGSDIPDPRKNTSEITADTLQAVADALGEVVSNDVHAAIDTASAPHDPFLRLAMPQLVDQSAVAATFSILRDAWRQHARVRFRYPNKQRSEALEERVVEPHLVTYYDGRYYLVAYDGRPRTNAWRQFALDAIVGPISRAGTFDRRAVPQPYRGENALGLFKSVKPIDVSIAISPEIASSVLARRWQRHQRVSALGHLWPIVTFSVCDIGEAVRWAFAFGIYARIVAPDEAISYACDLANSIRALHEPSVLREAK